MEPIISPWIFYWIDICDKINRTAIGLNSCLCVGGFLVIAWYFMDDEHPAEWEKNKLKKIMKPIVILFAVCCAIALFVPSKDTSMTMLAASVVTPDNIAAAQGNLVDFIQKIAEAASKAQEVAP